MRTLILILFILTLVNCNSQIVGRKASTRKVAALQGDSFINASVLLDPYFLNPVFDLDYYWYNNGKILITQGAGVGQLLHGEYKVQDALSGKLITRGYLDKGLKTGLWLSWHENERLKETSEWQKGLRYGSTKTYDLSGDLVNEVVYRKGIERSKRYKIKLPKLRKRRTIDQTSAQP